MSRRPTPLVQALAAEILSGGLAEQVAKALLPVLARSGTLSGAGVSSHLARPSGLIPSLGSLRPAIPLWHRPQARRPRAPWALTLLLLVGLLCWCVGDRVARGSGPNTGAGSASLSTQGGARTKDPPPPPPPPPPQSEGIDEPRVHRVLQPPADREPPLGQDPARTLPGSLRALATWMGAVSLLALFMAGCAAAAGALGILLWQRRRRNEITLGGGE